MRLCRLLVALFALPALAAALPAAAQDPDVAYAKYHRAAIAGDVEEMARYASEERRAELRAMSPAQRSAEAKMAVATMPRGFVLRAKNVSPDGQNARLFLAGEGPGTAGGNTETLYGTARLVRQGGEWRVAGIEWTNQDPGLPQASSAKPAARPAASGAASPTRAVAPVGSLEGAPVRKLGTQKPPCVYKPVMTQEDLDNCK